MLNKQWYKDHAIESALKATDAHERGDMQSYKMHSNDTVNYEKAAEGLSQ